MKKSTLILLAIALATAGIAAQKIKRSTKKEIKIFFEKSLNGENALFNEEKNIEIKDIAQTRERVWELWRNAVNKIDEEGLPQASTGDECNAYAWSIPTHPEPNAKMPFYYIHKGEKPAAGYPLYLYMHGSGPKTYEWETGLKLCKSFDDAPSAYFIPQIPSEKLYRWAVPPQQHAWEKLLRQAFLSSDIDANKIFFFGISEGGYGSQRLASFYADYLAGAGPMAGGEPLKNAPAENLANTAFSLQTGQKDYGFGRNYMTYTAGLTLDSLQALRPGHYPHSVVIVPEMGHSIDYRHTTPWLSKFTRNPHPKYLYWEDFEMYGRHRKGFGCIRVNETSRGNDEERTCYEMQIEENTITLAVTNVTYETTKEIQGIPMLFKKSHAKADKGNITIYLSEELFDFEKPVTVILNGKKVFGDVVAPDLKSMVESCALFFDPERVFPASINIDIR